METLLKIVYHNIEMFDRCAGGARSSIRPPDMDESFRIRMISKLLNSPDYLGRNYNNKKDSTKYLKNKKICKIIDYLRYYDGKLIDNNINNPNRKKYGISDTYVYLDGKDAIILEDTPPSNLDGGNATTSNTDIIDLQHSRKCDNNPCEKPYKSRKCDNNPCENPDGYLYLDGKDAIILEDNPPIKLDSGNATTCNTDIIDLQHSRKSRKCDDNSCENPDSYLYLDGKDAIILEDNPPINLDSGNATTCNTDIIDLQPSDNSNKCHENLDCECLKNKTHCTANDISIINTIYNTAAKINGVTINSPYLDGGTAINCGVLIIDLQYSQQSHLSNCTNS